MKIHLSMAYEARRREVHREAKIELLLEGVLLPSSCASSRRKAWLWDP